MARSEELKKIRRTDLRFPKFSQLKCNPDDNLREDYGDIMKLVNEILEAGEVIQPVVGVVVNNEFWVKSDGFRRYKALEIILKEHKKDMEVPFMNEPQKGYSNKDRIINMFLHAGGKDLTPLEQAKGIKKLIEEEKMSEKEIAKRLGVSQPHINKINKLNKMPEKVIELIRQGEVTASTVIKEAQGGRLEDFIEKYDRGEFAAQSPVEKDEQSILSEALGEMELPEGRPVKTRPIRSEKTEKTARIRPKDIRTKKEETKEPEVSSFKALKTFLKSYEKEPTTKEGALLLDFGTKLINNKFTINSFKRLFK